MTAENSTLSPHESMGETGLIVCKPFGEGGGSRWELSEDQFPGGQFREKSVAILGIDIEACVEAARGVRMGNYEDAAFFIVDRGYCFAIVDIVDPQQETVVASLGHKEVQSPGVGAVATESAVAPTRVSVLISQ
ncbi:MAG TPA: hypothetical protein VIT68_03245 [Candidatus Gracilibacteria bacterium]